MQNHEFDSLAELIPKINPDRNYWFVRTYGGDYYDAFLKGNYIAIGYDEITLETIYHAQSQKNNSHLEPQEILTQTIKDLFGEEEKRPGLASSQLLKFVYGMKKGDMVLIPSYASNYISIGEITQTPIYIENNPKDDCPFRKRKKVNWIKEISREEMDPKLYRLMFSHQTISEANDYAYIIDKITNNFYVKDDKAFLVLNVREKGEIGAKDLFGLGYHILIILEEINKEFNLGINIEDVEAKVKVESPGDIVYYGKDLLSLGIISIILHYVVGGDIDLKIGQDFQLKAKTKGLINQIIQFIKNKAVVENNAIILKENIRKLRIDEKQGVEIHDVTESNEIPVITISSKKNKQIGKKPLNEDESKQEDDFPF